MYLMVLNDGETYTNLEGCMLAHVPDDYDLEGIESELKDIHRGPFAVNFYGATRRFAFVKDHRIFLEDQTTMMIVKLDV